MKDLKKITEQQHIIYRTYITSSHGHEIKVMLLPLASERLIGGYHLKAPLQLNILSWAGKSLIALTTSDAKNSNCNLKSVFIQLKHPFVVADCHT